MGVLGLGRPGGGPDEEAMPGAEAQQAEEKVGVCVCVKVRRSQEGVGRRLSTLRGKGDDGGKSQRGDARN